MSDDIVWVRSALPNELRIDNSVTFGTLQTIVEEVKQLIEEGKWRHVTVERPWEYSSYADYLEFRGERPETELETTLRIANMKKAVVAAEKAKKTREENERKEYLRLKKKFEGKK